MLDAAKHYESQGYASYLIGVFCVLTKPEWQCRKKLVRNMKRPSKYRQREKEKRGKENEKKKTFGWGDLYESAVE